MSGAEMQKEGSEGKTRGTIRQEEGSLGPRSPLEVLRPPETKHTKKHDEQSYKNQRGNWRHPKSHCGQKQYECQKLSPLTTNLMIRSSPFLLLASSAHPTLGYQNILRESNKDTRLWGKL